MAKKILLGLIVALFCVRNLPWHLDDYDQAKQAYVSFEMVEQGHWWFQHTPRQDIATKPPLAGWISAALFYLTRWWDGAWRIPSLACALIILAALWKTGNQAMAGLGGVIAAGAFGLNLMAPRLATLVRTDMLLTLFIFLTGWLVYEKQRTAAPWSARERWMIFALLLGSMFTKGPIAYAFLLPGMLAFQWFTRGEKDRGRAWSGWWSWFAPLLFFLAWGVAGIWLSDDFYQQVVQKEFLGRFDLSEAPLHKHQPVYFYLAHLLRDLAPWSLLLIALPFFKSVRRQLMENRAALWLVCWSIGGLIFMSVVPSKRADRIFPVVPPLCLLLVHLLRACPVEGARTLVLSSTCAAVLLSGAYTLFNMVSGYRGHAGALAEFGSRVRASTAKTPERFAVISGRDEGMLLYLQKPAFLKLRDARVAWKAGQLDGLVLTEGDFEKFGPELQPARVADQSAPAAEKNSRYLFIVRAGK